MASIRRPCRDRLHSTLIEKVAMRWSFKIGKVAGTEIRIHLTLLLLLVWLGAVAAREGAPIDAINVIALICLAFVCVLLHELGHVFVALSFGITTPRIVLYPIGGIAWMKQIPREPRTEFLIALAGPAVNLFIAALSFLLIGGLFPLPPVESPFSLQGFLAALIWINLMLGLFNLIPAFPMDGGRALRAILAMRLPYAKATTIAVRIGEFFAIAIAVFSILGSQPVLFLISLLIFVSANAEGAVVKREHLLAGLNASDAAMKEFHTLQMQDSIHHAVTLMMNSSQPDFPVVNLGGQCTAIATRNSIIQALRDRGPNTQVSDVVRDIPAQIDLGVSANEALRLLVESGLPGAAIVDGNGILQKWLTLENVDDLLQTRAATHHFAIR